MLDTSSPSALPSGVFARRVLPIGSVVLLLGVLAAILFVTLRSPLKDDIAWLLYVARRWLGGRELYVDIVEVNPPLIVWISAIPLTIAGWLHVDPQLVAMPVFIAMVLGCAGWTAHLVRDRGGIFIHQLPVFALLGTALLILPGADLGQREHLLVSAFLPYLALFARRLDGRHTSGFTSAAAGVLAAIGSALKPQYVAVYAALECLALSRGLRPWRVMPMTAGVVMIAYAGLVTILCPAYLQRAVPMALALYGATDVPFRTLLVDSTLLICGEILLAILLWLRWRTLSDRSLVLTLVLFALTSTGICFLDGKDWYYHRLPATVVTVSGLLVWIANEVAAGRRTLRVPLLTAGLAVFVFCSASLRQLEPQTVEAVEPETTTVSRLEAILRAEHAKTYIAFSEWIALGFPIVNETDVTWTSRFDSMWALKGEVWRMQFDPAIDKEWPIARWVAQDFLAGCPDIAVVDTRPTIKYIKVLSAADPAFAQAWLRYRPIAFFDGLVVYKRGRRGCETVRIATNPTRSAAAQSEAAAEVR